MVVMGFVGIAILHATIPFIYILLGIVFNVFYTLLAPIELIIKKTTGKDRSKNILSIYCLFSALIVIGGPVLWLIALWKNT